MKLRLFLLLSLAAGFLCAWALRDYQRFQAAMEFRWQAEARVWRGDLTAAACLLERAWSEDPSQIDIGPELSAIYIRQGNLCAAKQALDRYVLLSRYRPTEVAQAYAQRGRFLLKLGDFQGAARDLRTACRMNPGDRHWRKDLAEANRRVYLR